MAQEVKFQFDKVDGYGIIYKYVENEKITVERRKLCADRSWPQGILHIKAGDADWIPTCEEFDSLCSMFQQAWEDPKGVVITTPRGVDVQFIPLVVVA